MKSSPKKTSKHSSEGALNIRNFPRDLRFACGAKANMQRQDLRQFVIKVLEDATRDVQLTS